MYNFLQKSRISLEFRKKKSTEDAIYCLALHLYHKLMQIVQILKYI